jgi:hypothetical protein
MKAASAGWETTVSAVACPCAHITKGCFAPANFVRQTTRTTSLTVGLNGLDPSRRDIRGVGVIQRNKQLSYSTPLCMKHADGCRHMNR